MVNEKPEVFDLIRIYNECEDKNVLPVSGGYLDQPQWYNEAFDFIRKCKDEWLKEKMEKVRSARK